MNVKNIVMYKRVTIGIIRIFTLVEGIGPPNNLSIVINYISITCDQVTDEFNNEFKH